MVANNSHSVIDVARLFAQSLPPDRHQDGQEAMRFARWFGETKPIRDIRPVDLESYVDSFGATAPNAVARADSLKSFLSFAYKQNFLPERMASHVRVRRSGTRTRQAVTATQPRPEVRVTAEGLAGLRAELESLLAQRPRIAAELQAARADGDVRENAPLDAAREAQGQLEARIRELEAMLRHATVVEEDDSAGAARIGSNVVIANLQTGARMSYQLVNAAEARPGTGRLSVESPVGQAIYGRRVGEEVQVSAPSGIIRFRIEQIDS